MGCVGSMGRLGGDNIARQGGGAIAWDGSMGRDDGDGEHGTGNRGIWTPRTDPIGRDEGVVGGGI